MAVEALVLERLDRGSAVDTQGDTGNLLPVPVGQEGSFGLRAMESNQRMLHKEACLAVETKYIPRVDPKWKAKICGKKFMVLLAPASFSASLSILKTK
jgi:hypothetical protein